MEPIKGYDEWKTGEPTNPQDERDVDFLEANLPLCRVCSVRPVFETTSDLSWHVSCSKCGVSMPGDSPEDAAMKWCLLTGRSGFRSCNHEVFLGY